MSLHIVGLIVIYVLPRFIRGERPQQSKTATVVPTSNGAHQTISSSPVAATNDVQTNLEKHSHEITKIVLSYNTNGMHKKAVQFVDDVPECDINVNNDNNKLAVNSISNGDYGANGSVCNESNATDANTVSEEDYRRHVTNDDQHLSMKIRERIDSETRYIEGIIDKTVTGIVELKDDLMRVNNDEMYPTYEYGNGVAGASEDGLRKRNLPDLKNGKEIEQFLRKEINNANVLPAVLSNGHAD